MIAGTLALHHVHHHVGKAQVVLGEQRVDSDWLHDVAHEKEALGVLQAALRQVPPGAAFVQRATLQRSGLAASNGKGTWDGLPCNSPGSWAEGLGRIARRCAGSPGSGRAR